MFKYLVIVAALLFSVATARAADLTTVTAVSATTPATILTGGKYVITEIRFLNSSASSNAATVKFYDSAANDTNYVVGAYNSYSTITTNYSSTFTNAAGIVVTNTWSGSYLLATANAASTNERPAIAGPYAMPYLSNTLIDGIAIAPATGFTVYSTQAGTLQLTYRKVSN